MIAIIAEKPSVGMDIARVVGADTRNDGYCSGNGYMVTWALGHLVSLAIPDTYGYTKTAEEDLPMLPDPFRLVSRQMRTDRGMVTDIAASKQLKVIESVFNRCDSIVVATDAGREGELIFRWIYDFLGCTKPFRRLWISSLTDEAIRKGLEELKKYDSEDIYVIGGEEIYREFLPYCDVAHVTKIDHEYLADAFFPDLDREQDWVVTADSEEQTYFDLEYTFLRYERRPKN